MDRRSITEVPAMNLIRFLAVLLVSALVLAACGSAAPSGADTPATPTADAPATDAPTDAPAPTDAAEPSPGATQGGGGGGGGAASACELATPEEVGNVLGASGVTVTMDSPGTPSFCIYSDASGAAIASTSLTAEGGGAAFGLWKSGAGVETVDGLGDDAVFDPSTASLLVLMGDAILSIAAGEGTADEAQRLAWARAIADLALGRM
jgi:hypothetical protein